MPCDDFFENEGIPYAAEFEAIAVRAVKIADFYDPGYKKFLILCWFDTTYGQWNGTRYDLRDSRERMSRFLAQTDSNTFEAYLEEPEPKQTP